MGLLREIADEVDSKLLADVAHVAGLIVAGIYPSPIELVDVVTQHTQKLRGPRSGLILGGKRSNLDENSTPQFFLVPRVARLCMYRCEGYSLSKKQCSLTLSNIRQMLSKRESYGRNF